MQITPGVPGSRAPRPQTGRNAGAGVRGGNVGLGGGAISAAWCGRPAGPHCMAVAGGSAHLGSSVRQRVRGSSYVSSGGTPRPSQVLVTVLPAVFLFLATRF